MYWYGILFQTDKNINRAKPTLYKDMNIFYLITFRLLSLIIVFHVVHAHIEFDSHQSHDDHISHEHRSLRELSFVIGNKRYANKNEFIQSGNRCGARKPTSEEVKASERIVAKWMANLNGRRDQAVTVEVQTYFHVITDGTDGDVSDSVLQDQLNVLNDAYLPFGFSFRLMGTTRTENAAWFLAGDNSSRAQLDMKTALRVGDKSTLNVYFSRIGGGSILGYATLPSDYELDPKDDGVVIQSQTLPGGPLDSYSEGKTLVHETGHWLGLYHTFETDLGFFQLINLFLSVFRIRNGCNTDGDGVSDTPSQRSATFGCPESRDSCPLRPGLDPINNYMDYSDDTCLREFTPGQRDRMAAMWNEYRA
jgi:hypothetical protein